MADSKRPPKPGAPARPPGGASVSLGGFALTKIGAQRYDLKDPYHLALTINWWGFLGLVAGLYLTANLMFAGLYSLDPDAVVNARPGSFLDVFFFSVETLATVGYGEMHPGSDYGHWVAGLEIIVGMAFTAIVTGLIFVRFSKPRARILYAEKAVVTRHNGCPTLMIRLGNGRMNMLTDTTIRLSALMLEKTTEGVNYRRAVELPLTTPRYAIFALTLTVMHEITEHSPLHGFDAERMLAESVRLIVSVEANDPALGAVVTDLRAYDPGSVAFGMRYTDAITIDDTGRTIADMRGISRMEADPAMAAHLAGRGGMA
jgi:inward rectifier potassium channel